MSTAMNIGAWRDRTNLFISYRQSYTHHPTGPSSSAARHHVPFHDNPADASERAGLMSSGDAVIEMDVLPPRWLDIEDDIAAALATIAAQMKKLDQLCAKHVLPGFDDEAEKAREEREIEALTADVTKGLAGCQRAIKRIETLARQPQSPSEAHLAMAKNLQIALATRVGEVGSLFRKRQAAYLKKLRALGGMSSPRERSGTPTVQNPYTDAAMLDEEADRSSAQSTLLQTAQVRRRTGVLDSAIETREREIEKIAQGVLDLSNIFQELNSMVIDQGTVLDRVDYNVERTAEHVQAAEKELTVATGYQKKSTKRKVMLLLFLLVVGMFILLLVKPKRRNAAAPPPPPPANPMNPGGELPPGVGRRGDRGGRTFARGVGVGEGEGRVEWKQRRRRGGGAGAAMRVLP